MRFLVDAQLPPALAHWLEARGHEAKAVRDMGLRNATDEVIWDFAERDGWVVVTKDDDFAERAMREDSGPQIVWLRIGNCINRVLVGWFAPQFPAILNELSAGQRIIEVERAED